MRRVFFCLVCLIIEDAAPLYAQVKTLNEVIKALQENREPAYIDGLMTTLAAKLQVVATDLKMETPNEHLAWLFTMQFVLAHVHESAIEAGRKAVTAPFIDEPVKKRSAVAAFDEAAMSSPLGKASVTAICCFQSRSKSYDAFTKVAWKTGRLSALAVAGNVVGSLLEQKESIPMVARIGYEVALWSVLNHMPTNIDRTARRVYANVLLALRQKTTENNPFENSETLAAFCSKHLGVNDHVRAFLIPWLAQLPDVMNAWYNWPLFLEISVGFQRLQSPVNFPYELVRGILFLFLKVRFSR